MTSPYSSGDLFQYLITYATVRTLLTHPTDTEE